MSFKLKLRTVLVLTVSFCLLYPLANASGATVENQDLQDPRFLAAYHSEFGLKLLHDGKNELATERFLKALLLDPQNRVALDSLKNLAQTPGEVSATNSLKMLRILDHLEYLQFLHTRYDSLVQENTRLREFVKINTPQNSTLIDPVKDLESKSQSRIGILPPNVGLQLPSDDHAEALEMVLDNLSLKRRAYTKEIDFWEAQNNQWRTIKRNLLGSSGNGLVAGLSQKYKSKLADVQTKLAERDKVVENQRHNIEYFQTELVSVRDNFSSLEDKFKVTDKKIADLTKRIAEMSMELYEKNQIITDKDSRLSKISQDLQETQEKVNLVQRILEEKNDRITTLEKEIVIAQATATINSSGNISGGGDSGAARLTVEQTGMLQLKNDFKDFQAQFKTEMEKSRNKVVQLENQLADLSGEYKMLSQQVIEKERVIANLKQSVQVRDLSLDKYRQAFLSSREKLDEINAITQLYRDRLIETRNHLRQKTEDLNRLQSTLSQKSTPVINEPVSKPQTNQLEKNLDLTFSRNIYKSLVNH